MNFLYAFLTIVVLCGAAGAGWWLRGRRALEDLAQSQGRAARSLASVEASVQQLGIELSRARSMCDGQALALEDEGEARERLEGELAASRATELALRAELASLRSDLAARTASLELARGVAREAEEVRDAQAVELSELQRAAAAAEQRGALLAAEEERRKAELAAMAGELAQLRTDTVRARREAAELAELARRLERSASEVLAADERAHRLASELEASKASAGSVRLVPELESEHRELPERVVVPAAGQGDLWAE